MPNNETTRPAIKIQRLKAIKDKEHDQRSTLKPILGLLNATTTSVGARARARVCRRALQGGRGKEIVKTLADCLMAIGNAKRLEIVQYCLEPRKFTAIIVNLKLNPASFKFHSEVLMDCDLIEKVERGVYRTTELGRKLLDLVEKATKISHE